MNSNKIRIKALKYPRNFLLFIKKIFSNFKANYDLLFSGIIKQNFFIGLNIFGLLLVKKSYKENLNFRMRTICT